MKVPATSMLPTSSKGPVLGSVAQPANYEAQRNHRPVRCGAVSPAGRATARIRRGPELEVPRRWLMSATLRRARAMSSRRPATGPIQAAGVPPPCEPGTSAHRRSLDPAATLRSGPRTQAEGLIGWSA